MYRAYTAASRRKDRHIDDRVKSAIQASHIHKEITGKHLHITKQIVQDELMYEEVEEKHPDNEQTRLIEQLNTQIEKAWNSRVMKVVKNSSYSGNPGRRKKTMRSCMGHPIVVSGGNVEAGEYSAFPASSSDPNVPRSVEETWQMADRIRNACKNPPMPLTPLVDSDPFLGGPASTFPSTWDNFGDVNLDFWGSQATANPPMAAAPFDMNNSGLLPEQSFDFSAFENVNLDAMNWGQLEPTNSTITRTDGLSAQGLDCTGLTR